MIMAMQTTALVRLFCLALAVYTVSKSVVHLNKVLEPNVSVKRTSHTIHGGSSNPYKLVEIGLCTVV